MKKKILFGVALGFLFLWLSLRNVDFQDVLSRLVSMEYQYTVPAFLLLIFMQFLRSYRWGLLIRPAQRIDQLRLFSITSVGFLFIITVPARIGELVRPYLLAKRSNVGMSFALASIVVERLFDVLSVVMMLMVVSFFMDIPSWMMRSGVILLGAMFVGLVALLALAHKREWFFRICSPLIEMIPEKHREAVDRWLKQFVEGLAVVVDPFLLFPVALLSVVIWIIGGCAIYCLFIANGFTLSLIAAFALMVIIIVGISIPTAPGFVGNWHFFAVMGLSLFGVSKTDAMTFAVVHHFISIVIPVILGFLFLPSNLSYIPSLRKVAVTDNGSCVTSKQDEVSSGH